MYESFNREIKIGDLVLFNLSGGKFSTVRYGIVIGKNTIYSSSGVHKINLSYLVSTPCKKEIEIKNELINKYKIYCLTQKSNSNYNTNIDNKILGGIYRQNNASMIYLYVGKASLYDNFCECIIKNQDLYIKLPNRYEKSLKEYVNKSKNEIPWYFLSDIIINTLGFKVSTKSCYRNLNFMQQNKKFVDYLGKIDISDVIKQNNKLLLKESGLSKDLCWYLIFES